MVIVDSIVSYQSKEVVFSEVAREERPDCEEVDDHRFDWPNIHFSSTETRSNIEQRSFC